MSNMDGVDVTLILNELLCDDQVPTAQQQACLPQNGMPHNVPAPYAFVPGMDDVSPTVCAVEYLYSTNDLAKGDGYFGEPMTTRLPLTGDHDKEVLIKKRRAEASRRCRLKKKMRMEELQAEVNRLGRKRTDPAHSSDASAIRERRLYLVAQYAAMYSNNTQQELMEVANELYDEDSIVVQPTGLLIKTLEGIDEIKGHLRRNLEVYPDIEFTKWEISTDREDASHMRVDFSFRGTQMKPVLDDKQIASLSSSAAKLRAILYTCSRGKLASVNGSCLITFKGDKISKQVWQIDVGNYFDKMCENAPGLRYLVLQAAAATSSRAASLTAEIST